MLLPKNSEGKRFLHKRLLRNKLCEKAALDVSALHKLRDLHLLYCNKRGVAKRVCSRLVVYHLSREKVGNEIQATYAQINNFREIARAGVIIIKKERKF